MVLSTLENHIPMMSIVAVKPKSSSAVTKLIVFFAPLGVRSRPLHELSESKFPDINIARSIRCKHKKTTQIIKSCPTTVTTKPVVERCKTGAFSIMIDESTDLKGFKRLAIMVRCFDIQRIGWLTEGARDSVADYCWDCKWQLQWDHRLPKLCAHPFQREIAKSYSVLAASVTLKTCVWRWVWRCWLYQWMTSLCIFISSLIKV